MNDQSDFRHLLRIARRRWPWIVLIPLICSALAFGVANRQADVFQATAEIRIDGTDIATDVVLITSQEVNAEARTQLGDVADDVLSIDASTVSDTKLASITARATSPASAALAANVWASSFATVRNDGQTADLRTELKGLREAADLLQPELIQVEGQIATLQAIADPTDDDRIQIADLRSRQSVLQGQQRDLVDRATSIQTQLATAPTIVTTTNQATEPRQPAEPKPMRQALFGLFAGVFLGVLAAALAEMLDDRIWEPRDLASATGGLPVLASVPPIGRAERGNRDPVAVSSPQHPASEAFGMLGRTLRHDEGIHQFSMIVATSASVGEGKSFVASNLAMVFAQLGENVVLVEMNFRDKGRDLPFDIDRTRGLADAVESNQSPTDFVVPIVGSGPGSLSVLPAGDAPINPSTFAASPKMADTLQKLRSEFDRVIIDAGSALVGTEAVSVAEQADGVCFVVRYQETRARDIERALGRLHQLGVVQMGVVICDAPDESFFVGQPSRSSATNRSEFDVRDDRSTDFGGS